MYETVREALAEHPWAETLLGVVLLAVAATIANLLTRRVLFTVLRRAWRVALHGERPVLLEAMIGRLANVVPALIVYAGILVVPHVSAPVAGLIQNVAVAFIILTLVLALSAALNLVNAVYQRRPEARNRPIKGYIQVLKLVLYCAGALLAIAALMNQSPLLLLSGLGALAAVLMLVFRDTILSLVASVQLTSNDMLRVGEWIEMPSAGADGDVIDIALHTVKVQNWDKTIVTIPTWKLISESFKNWRGMAEAGGRRIKRALLIDQNSVRFLTEKEEANLTRFALLRDYLAEKEKELAEWNASLEEAGHEPVNRRRQTNLGAFRAYALAYLKAHPRVSPTLTTMVRQLAPTPEGLPLEIYCFTATTAWVEYEGIQSDIFDHMIAILPEFSLRLFQAPSGRDFAALGAMAGQGEAPNPPVAPPGGI